MKIAFTAGGDGMDSLMDSRFGRAPKFILYDLDDNTFEVIDNKQNANAGRGAGIKAAELVARLRARVLVTGHCGPKAFRVLRLAGVKILYTDAPTVAKALQRYNEGLLSEATDSDVGGHWT